MLISLINNLDHFLLAMVRFYRKIPHGTFVHCTTYTSTPVISAFYSLNGLVVSLIVQGNTDIVLEGKLGSGWLMHYICCHENLWTGTSICGLTVAETELLVLKFLNELLEWFCHFFLKNLEQYIFFLLQNVLSKTSIETINIFYLSSLFKNTSDV